MSYGYSPSIPQRASPIGQKSGVINSIVFAPPVKNQATTKRADFKSRRILKYRHESDAPEDSFIQVVEKRIELINQHYDRIKLPYRFEMQIVDDKHAVLYMLILDENGQTIQCQDRIVTQENFGSILDKISTGEGFIFED